MIHFPWKLIWERFSNSDDVWEFFIEDFLSSKAYKTSQALLDKIFKKVQILFYTIYIRDFCMKLNFF